jgi:GT2 family glycosyltransferase
MQVAIVILNYNGRHFLEKFLEGVVRHSNQDNATVYVADNGSTDTSVEYLKNNFPTVQLVLSEENYGFAGGYNFALKQIKADYYVLLNSDVEVSANWINPIIELMESDKTIAACQPKVLAHYDKSLFEHAGGSGGWMDILGYPFCRGRIFSKLEKDNGQYDDIQEVFWATGAAMFIRADLYHSMEGLDDEYFAHMEEIDLCWRLKRAGYKNMVVPQSVVYHVGGGTLPPTSPRKVYLNFRNSLLTLLKNEPPSKLLWLVPLRLVLDGLAGVLFLTEGKFKEIWAIVQAHFYVYPRIFKIAKKRKHYKSIIEKASIGKPNYTGIYSKSVVLDFFIKKKQDFSDIIK